MFLTTPECILKSSSSASVSKGFFPSLTSFFFQTFQRRPNFYPIRLSLLFLNYFYLISTCGNLHAMTSAPPFLSPPSPCFLDVTASRSCACWILPAPTHQLSTSPLPAGVSPAFSEIHWSLDTPAVGSLVICCLPHAHNMDACG